MPLKYNNNQLLTRANSTVIVRIRWKITIRNRAGIVPVTCIVGFTATKSVAAAK